MTLPLESIELNSGQINGLPANPRQWTLTDVEKLAASLKETPELLEMRCPIVVPHEGKYVTLGGNLRIAAARVNKEAQVPCFVLEGATTAKMKEITIKDNGSFGKWDFDSLANEWDDLPLTDWSLPVWNEPDYAPNLNPTDKADTVTEDDIRAASGKLLDEVTPASVNMVEVICPHCGEVFKVKL